MANLNDKKTFIRSKIRDLLNEGNRKLVLVSDIYVYLDGIIIDPSDDDVVKILCKFNTSAMTNVEPTFGTIQHSTGLQEIIIPYEQIHSVYLLDASENLLNAFRTKYPKLYEKYSTGNKVEGCIILPRL